MHTAAFPKQNLVLASTAGISLLAIAIFIFHQHHRRELSGIDEDEDGDASGFGQEVPTHLRRLLHKEERRKDSVRFLAMKKPMYDNIEMYSPDSTLLCTISEKKASWYVRKKLGRWKSKNESIQLLFEPKAQPSEPNTYNQTHKKNICVVCGESHKFMRHYIVPYCYRTLLPDEYKAHMPHDIVILCPDCHLHSEQATQERQKELEKSLRRHPSSSRPSIPNRSLRSVRSAACALCQRRGQIPSDQVESYENLIKAHFGLDESSWLSRNLLEQATKMETSTPNPSYIPGPYLVVSSLANDEATIRNFIMDWRQHFIETMQPRFLPEGWSIDSPVRTGTWSLLLSQASNALIHSSGWMPARICTKNDLTNQFND